MKLIAALLLLVACGPDAETPVYVVPVTCAANCIPRRTVDGTDVPRGHPLANRGWCLYGWADGGGFTRWHPVPGIRVALDTWVCSMPQGQGAELQLFYDDSGAEQVLALNLTAPILPGAREAPSVGLGLPHR
jgi:hypothetical protein